ncbi:hypothetical protein [Nocardia sp. NPDC050710]|uniref:hypothetical protein n=1 Tax=Nocardia sp. NPDC050710 TaxID=3157220 RepID=UPI003410AB88
MNFPSLGEYRLAVQNPNIAFRNDNELKSGTVQLNPQKMPTVACGGFAATFQVSSGGTRWAVRCFHKKEGHERQLFDRYARIDEFITANSDLDFLVPVTYNPEGILVGGGFYPTVRMRWVEGKPLGLWLEDWSKTPHSASLDTVRARIRDAVAALQTRGAAHGDLQHGNILVCADHSIRLIDYDGMYLDNLADLGSIEQGHRNYQHPGRGRNYDSGLDVFATASIDLSLAALADKPTLWNDFGGTGENILFEATDFAAPDNSRLFTELLRVPGLEHRTRQFRAACLTAYPQISAALAGGSTTQSKQRHSVPAALVFAADEAEALRAEEGELVTVFGTIVRTNVFDTAYGRLAVINLGDYKQGDFTIVGYGPVADALYEKYGSTTRKGAKYLPGIKGARVAISGAITLYPSDHSSKLTPQIELDHAGLLRILDRGQFDAFIDAASRRGSMNAASTSLPIPAEAPRAPTAPPLDTSASASRTSSEPRTVTDRRTDLATGLHNLYKNRNLPPRPAQSPPTPPPSGPSKPESRSTNSSQPAHDPTRKPAARRPAPPQPPPPVPAQFRREELPRRTATTSASPPPSQRSTPPPQPARGPGPADHNVERSAAAAQPTPPQHPPPPVPPQYRREQFPRPISPPKQTHSPKQRRRNSAIAIGLLIGGAATALITGYQDRTSAPVLFQSATNDLACRIIPEGPEAGVRCDLEDYTYTPPNPAGCPAIRFGHVITLTPDGAGFACVTDTLADPRLPVLAPGDSKTVGPYTCVNATDGMTCRDTRPGGHRFRITRDSFELA